MPPCTGPPSTPSQQAPESPASAARCAIQQNIHRVTMQRSRKKRSTDESHTQSDDKENFTYLSYGRNFCRIGDPFNRISVIVEFGIKYELDGELADVSISKEHRHLLGSWNILKNIIPNFSQQMIDLRIDKRTRNSVYSLISQGRDNVRCDDTGSLKPAAPSYMLKSKDDIVSPSLTNASKALHGWAHLQCANMLCPIELPATRETYSEIEAGKIMVTADQFPRFLYPDDYSFNPTDMYSSILCGHFCYWIGKHIFQGPSASHEEPGYSRGKRGNAVLYGVTSMTPRSIAYIIIQAQFAISSATQWGVWDKGFDYQKFYWNIVDLFEDGDGQDIIAAFNYEIFGVSDPSVPSTMPQPLSGQSHFDLLREQWHAAKHAQLAQQEQQVEIEAEDPKDKDYQAGDPQDDDPQEELD